MEFNESLVKGGVSRSLIKFAIPVMLANILQIIYSLTDLYILGEFATKADVSAMTTSSQIMSLVTLGLSGLTMGIMVALGQHYGAKNKKELAGAVGSGSVFFVFIALVLTLPFLLLNSWLVGIMNTPAEAVPAAASYLRICSLGIIFILGFNVMGHVFRGLGNSKLALIFAAISCLINIVLDFVLVAGLRMGATGAAIATVVAQGSSLLLSVLYIWRRGLGFPLTRRDFIPRLKYIWQIVKIGAPISIQEILVTISFMMITAIINKRGVDASASVGIVEKMMGFFTLPTMAMASAVGAMSAQNIGANQRARAEKCMWIGILISLCIAVPICLFCAFFGRIPMSLFSKEADVILNGTLYIKSYVFDATGLAFVFLFNAYFTSCGHSLFAMAHSLLVTFAVRVQIVRIMADMEGTTLFHIGLGAPIATFVSLALCIPFFFWIKRRASRSERIAA